MKLKFLKYLLVAASMILALVACGGDDDDGNNNNNDNDNSNADYTTDQVVSVQDLAGSVLKSV